MAEGVARKEWPHHQILREHRQYTFRQYLRLQEAVPYLAQRKAIPKSVRKEIERIPENVDDNLNFLLAYLREAKVERFVRFIEALGDSTVAVKSHVALIDTLSPALEMISNADLEQVRRVRGVVKLVREGQPLETEVEGGIPAKSEEERGGGIPPTDPGVVYTQFETKIEGEPSFEVVQEAEIPPQSKEVLHTEPSEITARTETSAVGKVPTESREDIGAQTETKDTTERLSTLQLASPTTIRSNVIPGFVEPRFAEFFRRDNLAEGQTSWLLHNPAHGVRIDIPVEAVPDDIMIFAVIIHAYLNGNFEIPNEYEICTAIFVLQTDPVFKFLKPVSLKIPHSAIFDGDEEPDDLVVLRAPNPDTPMYGESDISIPPVYKFSDIIIDADYSEDYYVHVDLDHFSAVAGGKRRRRYRLRKSTLPLSLNRQGSLSKQRRSRRNRIKKNMKKAQRGDSIGSNHSSRESSYDGSFERREMFLERQQSPLVRQCSSAESDGPYTKHLHRQGAITRDDDCSLTPIYVQRQSSSIEDMSCNEICITCCNPVQCTTNWTTRFMVAPNTPTGRRALSVAAARFEKQCHVKMDQPVLRTAFPSNNFISFEPERWSSDDWIVNANSSSQISLDLVKCSELFLGPPHVEFEAECINQGCSTSLRREITVMGAETNGHPVYFTIKSTGRPVKRHSDVIYTQSWIYPEDSQILQALNNASNIALRPCADHCRLIADITLQLPCTVCDDLLDELKLTEVEKSYLMEEEKHDFAECMYKGFMKWIRGKYKPNLDELKLVLAKFGFQDIEVCDTDNHLHTELLSNYPELYDITCDRNLCTKLADKFDKRWRFVGHYLGLDNNNMDEFVSIANREGQTEAVIHMLQKWQQQHYGRAASVAALVKVVCRIQEHTGCMNEVRWFLEQVVAEITQENVI